MKKSEAILLALLGLAILGLLMVSYTSPAKSANSSYRDGHEIGYEMGYNAGFNEGKADCDCEEKECDD